MFGIGGCEEVWSSIFWAQRRGKHEHQMNIIVSGPQGHKQHTALELVGV